MRRGLNWKARPVVFECITRDCVLKANFVPRRREKKNVEERTRGKCPRYYLHRATGLIMI